MDLGNGLGHLTYSTLVHPGDTWEDIWASLTTYVPAVKERVAPDRRFGVSLRLSAASVGRLQADAAERLRLKAFLDDNEMYLYTVNAFPYGPFKNTVVMEDVYEPDWRTDARAEYTMAVADILAEVGGEGVNPSIQTAPLGFKPRVTGPDVVDAYTSQVTRVVAHLVDLQARTGRTVTLALEPEPHCYLETTDETVAYFEDRLFGEAVTEDLVLRTGLSTGEAQDAIRRHVGVVFDVGHQSVQFEDVDASLQQLADAGVEVFKLQEAAALHVDEVTPAVIAALRPFTDTVYLTQTVQRDERGLTRFLHLRDAIEAWEAEPTQCEWRTHFHMPVFLDDLGDFRTTRFVLEDALAFHRRNRLSTQLEIETYTWDVLPAHLKDGTIVDYVCNELEWVAAQLTG
ncbi:MAG: metabolite traffic protein EboE [Acidimicrobiia bacterium]|nr:metabolite traffic protein EboE [Acidimicrobiia bacterium]